MTDVTRILSAIDQGDAQAAEQLLPLVYDELRRLAAQKLSHEKPGQTLQATALVHEAYIRLVGEEDQHWDNRGHFFAAAAEAMRRILVENARRKKGLRHGGGQQRIPLEHAEIAIEAPSEDLIALDEALDKLAAKDKVKADLVKLRYFCGLSAEQAAESLGISAKRGIHLTQVTPTFSLLRHGDLPRARGRHRLPPESAGV
jgi:RNA polymerase sigma factor (TIGR02999 family)